MKHTTLRKGDLLLAMPYFRSKLYPIVEVVEVTAKEVKTKWASMQMRHRKNYGDILLVVTFEAIEKLKDLDKRIEALEEERINILKSLDRVEFEP